MKWAELTINKEKGQSLIELLIAMAIFVLIASAISWLIIDSYLANRLAKEKTTAVFLAKEGLEAARAIRDSGWANLTVGSHGLATSGGHWIFQGTEDDVSGQLKDGRRIVIVEKDQNHATVTSKVDWELTEARSQETSLLTSFTNWQETSSCASYCRLIGYSGGTCRQSWTQCFSHGEVHEEEGDEYCAGGPSQDTCCCAP